MNSNLCPRRPEKSEKREMAKIRFGAPGANPKIAEGNFRAWDAAGAWALFQHIVPKPGAGEQ